MDAQLRNWPANWPVWATLLLGLWLIASPFFLDYGETLAAAGAFWGFGFVVTVLAAYALTRPETWEEGVNVIVGLCLAVSPWLFDFATLRLPAGHAVLAGLLVMALASWPMLRDLPGDHWWHHTHR